MYNYKYNELGEIVEEKRNGETFKTLEYDDHRRLASTTVDTSDETLVYAPVYETRAEDGAIYADNAMKGMRLEGVFEQSVNKDKYGRPVSSVLNVGDVELMATEFGYVGANGRLTTMVERVTNKLYGFDNGCYKYTYDANGNITEIHTTCECDELVVSYVYDGLNRLTRENNFYLGKTYTYKYDAAGNILTKSTYAVTKGAVVTPEKVDTYKYSSTGWKDMLVNYNGTGIAYDMAGNPWSYRGHSLSWGRIRLLTTWDDITFSYNASGIRTRKGDTYYELDGDTVISETANGETIRYYYGSGGIVGFRYNGTRYYYEKNLQGDITAIYDANGTLYGSYIYDAWGNHIITYDAEGVATANPFRYRGYYYDRETGLYYLKSRYYDAELGRFINGDDISFLGADGTLGSYNLFAYCGDNPVSRVDSIGMFWQEIAQFIERAIVETGKTMGQWAYAYAGCGGIAVADGPVPVGDAVALFGVVLITAIAVGVGINNAVQCQEISIPKVEEKERIDARQRPPIIFPVNPNDFNPVGLIKVPRPGTKNGSFVSWMDPISNIEIFRWDENLNFENGPHYHVLGVDFHFKPGVDCVPEPFASMYFPN